MPSSTLEVANILSLYGQQFSECRSLSSEQKKAMEDIQACRTATLGGHVDVCSNGCGYSSISYNSCRNRHCPKCQNLRQAKWLEERTKRLLPTHYFHRVVTLPHELKPMILLNRELLYNLLFQAASQALLQLALGYERLRAQVGFTALLHTWDQDLHFHPHLHIIVTGGGLSPKGDQWVPSKNSFLVPIKALSKIIRAKFMEALDTAYQQGRLKGEIDCLKNLPNFRRFTRKLRRKKWVVYSKPPFGGSQHVYRYISRYTHRVAISNHRLLSLSKDTLTFRARDNDNPGHHRLVSITPQEFIRRFLMHILPPRFVKIRHYGLMASCNAKTKLETARALITLPPTPYSDPFNNQHSDSSESTSTQTWRETLRELTGIDLTVCPKCSTGKLLRDPLLKAEQNLSYLTPIWDSS